MPLLRSLKTFVGLLLQRCRPSWGLGCGRTWQRDGPAIARKSFPIAWGSVRLASGSSPIAPEGSRENHSRGKSARSWSMEGALDTVLMKVAVVALRQFARVGGTSYTSPKLNMLDGDSQSSSLHCAVVALRQLARALAGVRPRRSTVGARWIFQGVRLNAARLVAARPVLPRSSRMFHSGHFAAFEGFCPIDLSTEMPGT
jgi:hypothetical protein